jgi:hypothetical protein
MFHEKLMATQLIKKLPSCTEGVYDLLEDYAMTVTMTTMMVVTVCISLNTNQIEMSLFSTKQTSIWVRFPLFMRLQLLH